MHCYCLITGTKNLSDNNNAKIKSNITNKYVYYNAQWQSNRHSDMRGRRTLVDGRWRDPSLSAGIGVWVRDSGARRNGIWLAALHTN